MRPSNIKLLTFFQRKLISGLIAREFNIFLSSYGYCIDPDPFLSTIEDTSGLEWDARADSKTYQQDPYNQTHMLGYQDRPQDLLPVRISEKIREMSETSRESNKSSEVFASTQKSNKDLKDYYYTMYEDNLIFQEDMLNPKAFAARNNVDNLYYHQIMKAPSLREF